LAKKHSTDNKLGEHFITLLSYVQNQPGATDTNEFPILHLYMISLVL